MAMAEMMHSTPSPPLQLQVLNLGCNDIGDEGGKAIGNMLKFNNTVFSYSISLFQFSFRSTEVEYTRAWCW
jgi:Leucine Rich repeat